MNTLVDRVREIIRGGPTSETQAPPMADYTIQPGDTLGAIAQRMGTTVQALAQANGISNPNMIRAGATLRIPGGTGAAPPRPATAPAPATASAPQSGAYTVRQGDTLSRIAAQNGTSVEELARLNGISDPNRIGVGQTIRLPSAPTQSGTPLPRANVARPGGMQSAQLQASAEREVALAAQQQAMRLQNQTAPWPPGTAPGAPPPPPGLTPGNGVGIQTTPVQQGAPMPPPGPAQPIDFTQMSYQQLNEFAIEWMGMGRRIADLPPQFNDIMSIRRDQHEMEREAAMREADEIAERQQQENTRWAADQAAFFPPANGRNPRIAPERTPRTTMGEGEYLPEEYVRLGQLGANMQSAPGGNPLLGSLLRSTQQDGPPQGEGNVINSNYMAQPGRQPTLGQLAKRPWNTFSTAPYTGA